MEKKKLFLICLFTGIFGGHYFAIGKIGKGILYLFTFGLLGIGWAVDLIRILIVPDFLASVNETEAKHKQWREEQRRELAIQSENERLRLQQFKREGIPYCPKCHSTSLTANKKGFGVGKAAAGAIIAGPYGLLAGGIGSRKVTITCLNCGHKFKPGR